MRPIYVSLLLLLSWGNSSLCAQISQDSLRNAVWISGYGYSQSTNENYHVFFDFRGDSLRLDSQIIQNSLVLTYTNNSICDSAGNLLFFSNGCGIMDSKYQLLEGAERINKTGDAQDYICDELQGGRYSNSLLILPDYDSRTFNVIYSRIDFLTIAGGGTDRLYWAKVALNERDELEVNFIDSIIIDTFLYTGNLAACRHGNGMDWWVVAPAYSSEETLGKDSSYYLLHLSKDHFNIHKNTIGVSTDRYEESTGEAVFSPDGTKYARYTIHADLQIFDFDRCTGTFSNPIHVPIIDQADTSWAAGVAFSPSGRYLYVSSTSYIYQFDMLAADIPASKTTVAVYDGFFYPTYHLPTLFYQCELAPDGKIYVSCPGGKFTFHVIEHPDSAGMACQVTQHKYILGYPIAGGLPHHPNYRLGALPGGVCAGAGFPPLAAFSWQADSLVPSLVRFSDMSAYEPAGWLWDFGDGAISADSNPVHQYSADGFYRVCLKVSNPFGVDTVCQWVSVQTVGVDEASGDAIGLRLFPNPASDVLHLDFPYPSEIIWIALHNSIGQTVFENKSLVDAIPVGHLPPGVYVLHCRQRNGGVYRMKVVVQR